jgi:F-type H+-transporting ATPase subunit b
VRRRLILAVMFLVTAWSMWAFAANHQSARQPAAAATEPAEGDEPPPINWTDFGQETPPYIAMVINFGILVAGYYLVGKRPVQAALVSRRDSIAKEIEHAARMKQEAEARARIYMAKLENLEEETRVAREGLIRAGEAERDRIVAEAEAKAERMRKEAEFLVVQELKQVRQELLRDTVEAAIVAAEDLLRKRITPADQERVAEDYLADLAGRKGASGAPAPSRASRAEGEPS